MPHKFNAAHRNKIPKQKYRVANWSEYNEGLRQRGDLTVWLSDNAPPADALLLSGQIPVSEQVREKSLPVVERKRQTHGRLR